MALDLLDPTAFRAAIRYDPQTKQGSVYDVVRLVTGYAAKDITHEFNKIALKFPDVHSRVATFKFPGQGQRPTPVAHLSTLLEIAWLCPGLNAQQTRRGCAVTMCRALGGDLTLVDQIMKRHADVAGTEEQAMALEGTGVSGKPQALPSILLNKRRRRSVGGHVYIATSPLLSGCKVGMWRGGLRALKSRYMTYYGDSVDIRALPFSDCKGAEKAVHAHLKPFRISGELYKPEAAARAWNYLLACADSKICKMA